MQIGEVGSQAEDGHDLARHGDVEASFARVAVGGPAKRGDDFAQRPVVHVDGAAPGHPARVDVELVAPIDVIVDQRREQIVGGADGVEVAGEMEIDVLHGHDLGIAAAGSASLHAETGAEARLAHADDRLLADMIERIAKTDGGGGLAFAGRRGRDGGDEDQLAVGPAGERGDIVERDLRLVVAVWQDKFRRNVELLGSDLNDRPHFGGLRDFDVGFWLLVLIGCARAWFLGTFTRLN